MRLWALVCYFEKEFPNLDYIIFYQKCNYHYLITSKKHVVLYLKSTLYSGSPFIKFERDPTTFLFYHFMSIDNLTRRLSISVNLSTRTNVSKSATHPVRNLI